jgi:hypothetical protein
MRGVWTGVTEPMTDRHEINAGLQEMHRSAVAEAVGVQPLAGETRTRRAGGRSTWRRDTARRIG